MKQTKYLPKVYIVGGTNSGKSMLINSMMKKGKRPRETEKPSKKLLEQKYNILTVSSMPNTTLDFINVSDKLGIKYKVFDTPGIPLDKNLTNLIQNF